MEGTGERGGMPAMVLSVIVPARDEEAALPGCLDSLVAQSEPGWVLGEHWEITVIDDHSTDQTAEVARGYPGVRVIAAPALEKGWTGKAAACHRGAEAARGEWLLFTDAGTVHGASAGSRALVEAERYGAGLLSYGPRRVGAGLVGRSVLPLVLSEIATAYPAAQVNDAARRIAFADGAFLLMRADAYRATGGHGAVAASLVPEADLAFLAKRNKAPVRFRYAPEAVSVRAGEVWEKWTRKLALLVNNVLPLVLWRLLDLALLWGLPLLALGYPLPFVWERVALWLLWARTLLRMYRRAARSGSGAGGIWLSIFVGLPVFVALAYASWYRARMLKRVSWKGREYPVRRR